ncbi:MAG: hypothetical protein ACRES7_04910 [Gammaproteobacteria bacterium]
MTAEPSMPAVAELLPHGAEALCLDALAEYVAGERVTARLAVRAGLPLYDEKLGGIPAWAGIEIMAQTAGLFVGMDAIAAGGIPRVGYLIGVRRFRARCGLYEAGLELVIEANSRCSESVGLGCFVCRIEAGSKPLASATISVWRPPHKEPSGKPLA